jgi:hypothetical protein
MPLLLSALLFGANAGAPGSLQPSEWESTGAALHACSAARLTLEFLHLATGTAGREHNASSEPIKLTSRNQLCASDVSCSSALLVPDRRT